ncbi:hypothetical protein HDU67_008831 [Dinochytrium kinnereticum]|nr:hypothetical protein HDU67_008831 [Dinochytrium kinnereticum]
MATSPHHPPPSDDHPQPPVNSSSPPKQLPPSAAVIAIPPAAQKHAAEDEEDKVDMAGLDGRKRDPRICGVVLTRRRRVCLYWFAGANLLLLAIMIPLLIFVIGPKIAQDSIEKSDLTFDSVTIDKARTTSFALTSTGKISNAGFLDASISFPEPVSIYWTNRPNSEPDLLLGSLSLEPISVSGALPKSGALSMKDNTVSITNAEGMALFSTFLIKGSEFSWRLIGAPSATALGLSFKNLKMNKIVTMKGFSGLKDVVIKSFNLPDSDPIRGIRLTTQTQLINPAQISIELGDLFFDSYFKNERLGDLSGTGITLRPGVNDLVLSGRLVPLNDTDKLSEVFSFFVGGRASKLVVKGTKVVPPLGEVSWLSKGFVGLEMEVSLDPPSDQKQLVSNIQIPAISVSFDPSDPDGYTLKTSAPTITAFFFSPFDFPLTIRTASQNLSFLDPTTNQSFAQVIVPLVPATGDQYKNTLLTNFTNADLTAVKGAETAFSEFFKALTMEDVYRVPIKGLVSTEASTAAGNVTIRDVSLTDTLTFRGFQGLKQVSINDVQVRSGSPTAMNLEISTVIQNPSNLSLFANADVAMELEVEGERLGRVLLPNMTLVPGRNVFLARSSFEPRGEGAVRVGRRLLSDFLAGRESAVSITGTPTSTPYKSLAAAFSSLKISATLPGQTAQLITASHLDFQDITSPTAPVYLTLFNPLATDFSILSIKASITYRGSVIGVIDSDLSRNPVRVAAGSAGVSPAVECRLTINVLALRALVEGMRGELRVDAGATLLTSVGEYVTTVDYEQKGVVTRLGAP